jgi:hypothetical protein
MIRPAFARLALLLVAPAAFAQSGSLAPAPWLDPDQPQLWLTQPGPKAISVLAPIATASKVAVRNAYNTNYVPAMPAMGWTGSVAGCNAGTISTAFKEWTISRVNYFRAMAGLPGNITLDAASSVGAQQAALVYTAQSIAQGSFYLSHTITPDKACYTASANTAAGSSNIAIGLGSATFDDVIPRYVDDGGQDVLGHRRWVLFPPQTTMGVGSTPGGATYGANALVVFNGWGTRPATPNGVAWPNAGYVPMQVLPPGKIWSWSYNGANFASANVTMTANGSGIPVTIGTAGSFNGYGDNTMSWTITPNIVKDTVYVVSITGITGAPMTSYSYTVRPYDPADPIGGATMDFNRDGMPDVLFRHSTTGTTYLWRMNNTAFLSDQLVTTIDPSWTLAGVGDFNNDGHNDILWRNNSTGTIYVWFLVNGAYVSDVALATIDPVWKIEAVADFNNNGRPDLLIRNTATGMAYIWYYNGTTFVSDQAMFNVDPVWIVEGVGDFNGDGYPDLFFRNTVTGLAFVWNWSGTALTTSQFVFGIDPVWTVAQIADYNADGQPDLVFRNTSTGVTFVWYMNGYSLAGDAFLFFIDPAWKMVPR